MAQKTEAQVTIGGKTYTLSGYESEEYILKVADYLNKKIDELTADSEYTKLPADMRQILLNLNIADDYFKMMARNEELSALIDKKDNDLYDIKLNYWLPRGAEKPFWERWPQGPTRSTWEGRSSARGPMRRISHRRI